MPTLIDLLSLSARDRERLGPFDGESRAGLLDGGQARLARRALYLASPDRLAEEAVIAGHYKLILIGDPGAAALSPLSGYR